MLCPTWKFGADTHLLKLQRLQNKILSIIAKFPKSTAVREVHISFHVPYIYDYITKLRRQQAEVIQSNENANVRSFGQGEA
jgi:hypothetical protein